MNTLVKILVFGVIILVAIGVIHFITTQ